MTYFPSRRFDDTSLLGVMVKDRVGIVNVNIDFSLDVKRAEHIYLTVFAAYIGMAHTCASFIADTEINHFVIVE